MMVRSHALTLVKFQPRLFVVSLRKPDSYFNQDWLTEDMPIYASSHAEAVRVAVGIHFGPRPPAKPETVVASVKIPGSQWHSVRADSSGWVVGGLPYLVSPSAPHEEQLVRRLDQVESDFRATKETLEVYKAAMEAETLPNIVALRGRLGELGYLISLDDLRFSLRAEGLRVIAWGDRGG